MALCKPCKETQFCLRGEGTDLYLTGRVWRPPRKHPCGAHCRSSLGARWPSMNVMASLLHLLCNTEVSQAANDDCSILNSLIFLGTKESCKSFDYTQSPGNSYWRIKKKPFSFPSQPPFKNSWQIWLIFQGNSRIFAEGFCDSSGDGC